MNCSVKWNNVRCFVKIKRGFAEKSSDKTVQVLLGLATLKVSYK